MIDLDRLIVAFDNGLRTLLAPAHSARPVPGDGAAATELSASEREVAAAVERFAAELS